MTRLLNVMLRMAAPSHIWIFSPESWMSVNTQLLTVTSSKSPRDSRPMRIPAHWLRNTQLVMTPQELAAYIPAP